MSKMNRLLLILLGCGVVLAIVLLVQSRSKKGDEVNTLSTSSAPHDLRFRNTAIFDGKTEAGVPFVDRLYKASDCVAIAHRTTFFKSPARARQELEAELKKAVTMIERAPVVNNAGAQVGERVLLTVKTDGQNKTATELLWNNDSELHSIASPSVEHVLEFEKAWQSKSEKISVRLNSGNVAFTELEKREGKSEEGIPFSEKKFRSSDCEFVTLRIERFPSADSARQKLDAMLASSTSIMERGPKSDPEGRIVGERAVANFSAPVSSGHIEDTAVLWTNGSELHSILGIFNQVFLFEKQNQ